MTNQNPETSTPSEDPKILDGRNLAHLLAGAVDDIENIGSREGKPVGTPTGFEDLDAVLGGLRPGNVYALTGPSGCGVSTLALDLARVAAIKHGLTTLMLSSQSPAKEILFRLLAAESRVAHHALRGGLMNDGDWTRLARRMSEVAEAPLFIDDTQDMPMSGVRARTREAKFDHDLRLLVIDGVAKYGDGRTRPDVVGSEIKKLAIELDIPIVIGLPPIEGLGRAGIINGATRSPWTPSVDVLIGIYRPDLTDAESPRAGEADLIVVKHRNGPTGTVTLAFQAHYSRFVSMTTG